MTEFKEKGEVVNTLVKEIETAFSPPDPMIIERLSDRDEWVQKQASGRVHIRPPQRDKSKMIVLDTRNKDLFYIFNIAAGVATNKWDGFHQIGSFDSYGVSGWELWKKPESSDDKILQELKEEMLKRARQH